MPAFRVLYAASEAGLTLAVSGVLRLADGQWWDGTKWGAPPVLAPGVPPGPVFKLAALAQGRLGCYYWASYPTDSTGFGPVTGTIACFVHNLITGKDEGIATAQLVNGDDIPPPAAATPGGAVPAMPTRLTINVPAQTINVPAQTINVPGQQVTGTLGT